MKGWQRTTPNEWRTCGFRIQRWHANDRGNRVAQYAVTHNGNPLLDWPQPTTLAQAKKQAEQYAQLLEVRAMRTARSR